MSGKKIKLIRQVVGKAIVQMSLNSNEARWLYDQLKQNYSKGHIHNIAYIMGKVSAMASDRRAIEREERINL